ncbi:hypothetical protein B0H19DRAFT_1253595 [Mycena capillaripes]|nr:hypothetical protein B0H19DRAFT_1253595 [Mycena capillaripes]
MPPHSLPTDDPDLGLSQDYTDMDPSYFESIPGLDGQDFDPSTALFFPAPQQSEDHLIPPIEYYDADSGEAADDSFDDENEIWDEQQPSRPSDEQGGCQAKALLLEAPLNPLIVLLPQVGGGGAWHEALLHSTPTRLRTCIPPSDRGDTETRAMHCVRSQMLSTKSPPQEPVTRVAGRSAPLTLLLKETNWVPVNPLLPPPRPVSPPASNLQPAPISHAPTPNSGPAPVSATAPATPPRAPNPRAPNPVSAPAPNSASTRAPAAFPRVPASSVTAAVAPPKPRKQAEMPRLQLQPATPPQVLATTSPIQPELFCGQFTEFLNLGRFREAELPLPPTHWAVNHIRRAHSGSPPPSPPNAPSVHPAPRHMPSVPPSYVPSLRHHTVNPADVLPANLNSSGEDVGVEGVEGAESAESAEGAEGFNGEGFLYEPAKPGRPTKEQTAALHTCRRRILALLRDLGLEYNVSAACLLDEVSKAFKGTMLRVKNPWNIYCWMARHPDWCGSEVRRILPDFDANCHQMPTLSPDHLSQMCQGFQEEYGEHDEYLRLLKDYEEVHMLEAEPTIVQRQQRVSRAVKEMKCTLDELRDTDQVEGMFVLCGSSVNVDNKIGHHFAASGLAEFTLVFKTGKDHPGLMPDNFLGMAKTFGKPASNPHQRWPYPMRRLGLSPCAPGTPSHRLLHHFSHCGPGQGMRFENPGWDLLETDIMIFGHNYAVPCPPGPPTLPAVIKHWHTSSGAFVPCEDGNRKLWLVKYDLDRAVLAKKLLPGDTITEEPEEVEEVAPQRKAKGKKPKPRVEDDEVKEVPGPRRQVRPRKAKTKSKSRAPAVERDEPEEEEPFASQPTPRTRQWPSQGGGGTKRVPLYADDSDEMMEELLDLNPSEYHNNEEKPPAKPSARSQGKRPADEQERPIAHPPQKRSQHEQSAPGSAQPSAQPSEQPSAAPTTRDVTKPPKPQNKQPQPNPSQVSYVDRPPPGATFTDTFYDVNARPAGQLYATQPGQAVSLLVPAGVRGDNPFDGQPVAGPSCGGGEAQRLVPKPCYHSLPTTAATPALAAPPAPSAPPSAPPAAPAASAPPVLPAGLDIASLIANIPPALLAASLVNALQQMQGPQ